MASLETFLSGMETLSDPRRSPGPMSLETFLSGMETRCTEEESGSRPPSLETFLSGMETATVVSILALSLTLKPSLVEWKLSSSIISNLGTIYP